MISIRDCTDSPSSFYNHDCLLHPLSLALLDSSPKRGAKGGLYGFAQVFIKNRKCLPRNPSVRPIGPASSALH